MSDAIEKPAELLPEAVSIAALLEAISTVVHAPEDLRSELENQTSEPAVEPTTGLAAIPAKPAVYALLTTDGSPVLVATTADLRRALQSRLIEASSSSGRADYAGISDLVRYRRVGSAFAASWWYYRVVRALFPNHHADMLAWNNAWFVSVNPHLDFPRFAISDSLAAAPALSIGPLPTRRQARVIVEALEDIFDLCRYYDILRQAPHGQPCAYKELGKCPAPCDGTISMADYHRQINAATSFLSDPHGLRMQWLGDQERLMRSAASTMDFRLAATLKHKLELAEKLAAGPLAGLQRIDKWKYLIIQRGRTPRWIASFIAGSGWIASLPEVAAKDAAESVDSWLTLCRGKKTAFEHCPEFSVEAIAALVAYHANRPRDAGLYIPMEDDISAELLRRKLAAWLDRESSHDMTEINSDTTQ